MSIGYISAQWDIRPVISCRMGKCLSEAKEEPRVKPEAVQRRSRSTDLISHWAGIILMYTMLRLF